MTRLAEALATRLHALDTQGLLRDPSLDAAAEARWSAAELGEPFLDVSSNDYLGFASQLVSRETAGAGASRLIHATRDAHRALEAALAQWLGADSALLFSSGYAANLGAIAALPAAGDVILSDRLNHASIIDGCRLSPASVQVVDHLDLDGIETALAGMPPGRAWVVTESYFSMDGTSPDLRALADLCRTHDAALIVDEAHALGIFGPQGRGLCAAAGVQPDVLIGTFGKAFGVHGAFVAGSSALRTWLWNRARSFVFSTATSPALASTAHARLTDVRQADEAREHLAGLCGSFQQALAELNVPFHVKRHGPIFPIPIGATDRTLAVAARLRALGILVGAVRPPTVPDGESRLRITLNATLTQVDVQRLVTALASALEG